MSWRVETTEIINSNFWNPIKWPFIFVRIKARWNLNQKLFKLLFCSRNFFRALVLAQWFYLHLKFGLHSPNVNLSLLYQLSIHVPNAPGTWAKVSRTDNGSEWNSTLTCGVVLSTLISTRLLAVIDVRKRPKAILFHAINFHKTKIKLQQKKNTKVMMQDLTPNFYLGKVKTKSSKR